MGDIPEVQNILRRFRALLTGDSAQLELTRV
jgi:hypothetical protein